MLNLWIAEERKLYCKQEEAHSKTDVRLRYAQRFEGEISILYEIG